MHALVDGHNALFRLRLTGATAEATRGALLKLVGRVTTDATVFFDAQGAPLSAPGVSREGGLAVRFCRAAEADEEILATVRAAAQPAGLLVVSDDRELTGRARQLGARAIGVEAWLAAAAPREEGFPERVPTPAGGKPLSAADFGLPPVIDLNAPVDSLRAPPRPVRAAAAAPGPAPASPGAPPAPPKPPEPRAPATLPTPATDAQAKARATLARLEAAHPKRHVLLCAEPTKAKCADAGQGRAVWEYLKQRARELGLDALKPLEGCTPGPALLRTKVDCLRVCADGPICVVYPDGVWYRGVTIEAMERILVEHVLGGRVVTEHLLGRAPLEGRP